VHTGDLAIPRVDPPARTRPDIGRVVFSLAWKRLWSSRGLRIWELIFQSFLAAYLGFLTFRYVPPVISDIIFIVVYVHVALLTVILVGPWVYAVQISSAQSNEIIRTVPIPARIILGARFYAVALTWLRLFSPLIVLAVLAFSFKGSNQAMRTMDWTGFFSFQLSYFTTDPSEPFPFQWNPRLVLPLLGILQIMSWVALPMTWGLLQATKFPNGGPAYALSYIAYLIIPAILAYLVFISEANFTPWVVPLISSLAGLILVFVFGRIACSAFGNRSK
jgi:hypothetical protein